MDTSVVFQRTDKGNEELDTRKYGLPMTLRRGLILVDGRSDVAKIIEKGAGVQNVVACLDELEKAGFIAPVAGGGVTSAPVTGNVKEQLMEAARQILGEKDSQKILTKLERAPDTRDGLEETLAMCKKLVKLTIDEKKAEQLMARCEEILRNM